MLIIGKNGRLAKTFAEHLSGQAYFFDRQELDIAKPDKVAEVLDRADRLNLDGPRVLVNTAAFTNVDLAESNREEAYLVNATAPGALAKWADANGYLMVQYSTDYVYPGVGHEPWSEADNGCPVNFYGQTKLEGDYNVGKVCSRHLIFRTTWLYGRGENFPRSLLRLAEDRDVLNVVEDQIAGPTHLDELVRCSLIAINQATKVPSQLALWGSYNLVNSGFVSKFHFAQRCLDLAHKYKLVTRIPKVQPVNSDFFHLAARRPLNSRLSIEKFESAFRVRPKHWDQSLDEWIKAESLESQI